MRVRICRPCNSPGTGLPGVSHFRGPGGVGANRIPTRSTELAVVPSASAPIRPGRPFRFVASRRRLADPQGSDRFDRPKPPYALPFNLGPKAQSPETARWFRQRRRYRPHRRNIRSEDPTSRQRRPYWDRRPDRFCRAKRFQAETSNPPTLLPRRLSLFRQTMLNPERSRAPGFRLKARPTDRHPQPTRRSLRTPDSAGHVDTLLACKERFLQTRLANNKRMTF